MSHPNMPHEQAKVQGLIRIALLAGVLSFGAITWFLHRQPNYVAPGDNEQLRMALGAAMLLATAVVAFARYKLGTVHTEQELGAFRLIGWTAGESAALAGAVYYFLTDNPTLYIIGLFVLLAAFIVIPLRR